MMLKKFLLVLAFISLLLLSFFLSQKYLSFFAFIRPETQIIEQIKDNLQEKELPLKKYSIPNLAAEAKENQKIYPEIEIVKLLNEDDLESSVDIYLFKYRSQGKTISGTINISREILTSSEPIEDLPIIVMIRGYVPLEIYYPGNGTKNAAKVLAENAFITIAPDYLGFGESDPETEDPWENRFVKIKNTADLILTLRQNNTLILPKPTTDLTASSAATKNIKLTFNHEKMAIWGHSNGGQIAVTTLEVLGENIPTSLWAPVLAPFPYSVLYFSDEDLDEGKEARKFVALFEEDYDVFDFSLTQHLDLLNAKLQIQHGSNDDSALPVWTTDFLAKVELENKKRRENNLKEIEIDHYQYPGAGHNLEGAWNTAIQKDLLFFKQELKIE